MRASGCLHHSENFAQKDFHCMARSNFGAAGNILLGGTCVSEFLSEHSIFN